MSRGHARGRVNPIFGNALKQHRQSRRLTLRALGGLVGADHSLLSKVERGQRRTTAALARACDDALQARGALVAALAAKDAVLRPMELPLQAPRLIGRAPELAQIGRALRPDSGQAGIVMIDGAPGSGKTALALHWAHNAREHYPDGQLYVDMRGSSASGHLSVPPEQVLEDWLAALGVADIPTNLQERSHLFRSLLANQRILMVLDNVASPAQIKPFLPAGRGCAVLVTGRGSLAVAAARYSAQRVTVGPLTDADAVALLHAALGGSWAETELAALRSVARACAGLPLALRIIAERIAALPERSIAELVRDLSARPALDALGIPRPRPWDNGERKPRRKDPAGWQQRHD